MLGSTRHSEPTTIAHVAITRAVSRALEHCELTHLARRPIDLGLARHQHVAYEQALREAGCEVRQLAEQPWHPDSVFVEDTIVALDEGAVVTRPGAPSRRGEVASMAAALEGLRTLLRIQPPGTLDGGDVLRLDRVLYVGASARSNAEGIAQLGRLLAPFGYRVEAVPLRDCLHLKTAVTQVAADRLLLNPAWVDADRFAGWESVPIDPAEPHAANALRVGGAVIYPVSCPRTAAALRKLGIDVRSVDMSETEKAEGGVTCCSVILEV
ncbi:MAG: dimethylargininase [Xanthomonadales bacterium]|nr:dimethylargininase [Xanthomonadales bacterium]ODU94821.1 MAG: dimethylargininase [Rhodanobacter sp. SCN 66-43]OJY82808.1 MAG: dimethylargininase [Xanthomonadales bacterium 66-474]